MMRVSSRAADDLGSAEKAVTRKLVQHAISNAVQSDGRSLGEVSPPLLRPAQGLPCQEIGNQQHARACHFHLSMAGQNLI